MTPSEPDSGEHTESDGETSLLSDDTSTSRVNAKASTAKKS